MILVQFFFINMPPFPHISVKHSHFKHHKNKTKATLLFTSECSIDPIT